jgi:hypothetical protein
MVAFLYPRSTFTTDYEQNQNNWYTFPVHICVIMAIEGAATKHIIQAYAQAFVEISQSVLCTLYDTLDTGEAWYANEHESIDSATFKGDTASAYQCSVTVRRLTTCARLLTSHLFLITTSIAQNQPRLIAASHPDSSLAGLQPRYRPPGLPTTRHAS